MTTELSSDDKLMAALSYWGSLALGFLPALVIYFVKKDESSWIKKHALQALFLNLAFIAASIVLIIVSSVVGLITFGLGSLLITLIHVGVFLGWAAYVVILGIQVFQGQDKDVPMITDMIRSHLGAS